LKNVTSRLQTLLLPQLPPVHQYFQPFINFSGLFWLGWVSEDLSKIFPGWMSNVGMETAQRIHFRYPIGNFWRQVMQQELCHVEYRLRLIWRERLMLSIKYHIKLQILKTTRFGKTNRCKARWPLWHAGRVDNYRQISQNEAFSLVKRIRRYVQNGPLMTILVLVWR